MSNDHDCQCFDINDDLAEMLTELNIHDVEPWSMEEHRLAYKEISGALDKTLSQIIPLLCRKYKIGREMILHLLAETTKEFGIALELGSLGLTDVEANECWVRINSVLRETAAKKRRRREE